MKVSIPGKRVEVEYDEDLVSTEGMGGWWLVDVAIEADGVTYAVRFELVLG